MSLKVMEQAEGSTNCHRCGTVTQSIKGKKLSLSNKNKDINKMVGVEEPKMPKIFEKMI